ncbi:hypothetical protein OCH239_15595 [Roseivivax halodurans JCM 10272]|uniref:Uncharacterized protein n=1 Tax=Roseivivax halodurans JCM 10272 TaxID=1449350 RepID=X7EA84_9RHOB|nr:hypothetical protein OCH239_15595 [Roseivivax halodurans JCM 10272]
MSRSEFLLHPLRFTPPASPSLSGIFRICEFRKALWLAWGILQQLFERKAMFLGGFFRRGHCFSPLTLVVALESFLNILLKIYQVVSRHLA